MKLFGWKSRCSKKKEKKKNGKTEFSGFRKSEEKVEKLNSDFEISRKFLKDILLKEQFLKRNLAKTTQQENNNCQNQHSKFNKTNKNEKRKIIIAEKEINKTNDCKTARVSEGKLENELKFDLMERKRMDFWIYEGSMKFFNLEVTRNEHFWQSSQKKT